MPFHQEGQLYLLGQAEISELVMRAFQLKGDLPQQLAAPYIPTVQAADLTGAEYMPLRRWTRYASRASSAAVAGQFSQCVFGSNLPGRFMAVLEAVQVRTGAAATIRWGITGDSLGSIAPLVGAGSVQDDRSATTATIAGRSFFGVDGDSSVANPLTASHPHLEGAGTATVTLPIDPSRPFILTNKPIQGFGRSLFIVTTTAVNIQVDAVMFWRERPLMETEF